MFPLKDNLPTRDLPLVTILLIVANVVAYVLLQPKSGIDLGGGSLENGPLFHYGAIPYELTHPGQHCEVVAGGTAARCGTGLGNGGIPTALSLFTAMFTHAGLLHLGGNMLFLWIFGNNVEDSMGRARFVLFYLLGGLAATAGQTLVEPNAIVPTLGASGAVAGVLGGYILLYPRAKVLTLVFVVLFFTILELPAILFLGIWFGQQLLFGALDLTNPAGGGGGVAYLAHVGGFVFGALFIKLFATRRNEYAQPRGLAS
ncbi:MAG: rhomboid family intrarane serine protease [Solirubrobacterales bacterium]|nr:rhomboid family intrarane serine protease [Solirubrobacterales bacterium]